MSIYRIEDGEAKSIQETTFQQQGMLERRDIQKMLVNSINIIVPNSMVLTDEFGDWSDGKRRIDILCLSKNANLVVVELKRTDDGGHMDLQAIRYASMVSSMTFNEAVQTHNEFLRKAGKSETAELDILNFLEWDDETSGTFNDDVSIVLASAEFDKEITTTVMWLNTFEINIICVRVKPYVLDGKVLINVEQIIPLPEAAEYQVRVRLKERQEKQARTQDRDTTRFDLTIYGETLRNLTKRRLVFHIAKAAIQKGATPQEVLPDVRCWIIVEGQYSSRNFLHAAAISRCEDSSKSEIGRFFTNDSELFIEKNRTYSMTKMWGASAIQTADHIISKFSLVDISYKPVTE